MKQKFSELDTQIIGKELGNLLGERIKEVKGDKNSIILSFQKSSYGIFISINPQNYRLHIIKDSRVEYEFHPFHSHLKGLRFRGIKTPLGERIFYLLFEGKDRKGFPKRLILAVELTGKYSNAILVDSKGTILDAHKRVEESKSRVRTVIPGIRYETPPPKPDSLWKLEREKIETFLKKHFPYTKKEFEEKDPISILNLLQNSIENCIPVLYLSENFSPLYYSPMDVKNLSNLPRIYFKTYSEVIETYFRERGKSEEKRGKDPLIHLFSQLEKLKDFDMERKRGELIIANLHLIKRGVKKLIHNGIEIEIDEGEDPVELAQEYFRRYRKKKRGYYTLLNKIEQIKEGLIERKEKEERIEEHPKPYLEYYSPSGFKVLVGKNARGNELITFSIAKERDLFFHVKDAPGAHVILIKGGREPSEEDIYFAARIALEHSRVSQDKKGLVSITEKKYVKRAKGKRGLVILQKERVIHVR
jgi:predicted ribosome quality control (RQC) complex YloA/Tae2 family protein